MQAQVRIGRHRIHHGPVGLLVAALGLWWTSTDWHDRHVWIRDLIREAR